MNPLVFADEWNTDAALLERSWPKPGMHCILSEQDEGIIINGEWLGQWAHPWQVSCSYEFAEDGTGTWVAQLRPGFVNGRDAHMAMPEGWPEKGLPARDVPLTDEIEPYLPLAGWRNPLTPAGISATLGGDIVYSAGEGYPPFFATIGVKPAAKGGTLGKTGAAEAEHDPRRTREIRAMDIVLSKPRPGTRLDVGVGEAIVEARIEKLDYVFVNDYVRLTEGRAKLRATSKHRPIPEQDLQGLYGTLLSAGDPQFDELKIATVWMVSPPDTPSDAVPDHTWTPMSQHFVFWNLMHATRVIPPKAPLPPLQLFIPLAGGIAQPIINGILSGINDRFAELSAFFGKGDTRGKFWSI